MEQESPTHGRVFPGLHAVGVAGGARVTAYILRCCRLRSLRKNGGFAFYSTGQENGHCEKQTRQQDALRPTALQNQFLGHYDPSFQMKVR
jgi:hypothetical protein